MNSVALVIGRSPSESVTPKRISDSTVILAELLLRILLAILPILVKVIGQRNETRKKEPDDKDAGDQECHVDDSARSSFTD